MKTARKNSPKIWSSVLPSPDEGAHKYHRGHCVIFAAPELTGATRLAAEAALASGVGLVSVIAPVRGDIYRSTLPADIMVTEHFNTEDKRVTACLVGPGGTCESHKAVVEQAGDTPFVLDSAALPKPEDLPCPSHRILTPHSGELSRLFPDLEADKPADVIKAAARAGAIIVAKGPTTFIADPQGRLVVNDKPNPALARGGTGDVLAGLIAGLIAQNMSAFEAACAAVWIHSEAAKGKGHSFTASDLVAEIGRVINEEVTE